MRNKITGWIICTSIECFSTTFCFSFYNFSTTIFAWTFCQWNRFCIMTFREPCTSKEESKTTKFFYHWFSTQITYFISFFIQKAFYTFLVFHYIINSFLKWSIEITNNVIPNQFICFNLVKFIFYLSSKFFVNNSRETFYKNLVNHFSKFSWNQLLI